MATGTDAGLLERPKAQSVYKHGLLEQYVIRAAMQERSLLAGDERRLVGPWARAILLMRRQRRLDQAVSHISRQSTLTEIRVVTR